MPNHLQRNILLSLLSIVTGVVMVQCSGQSAPTHRPNGMTCQTHSNSTDGGLNVSTETDCNFKCPDGRLLSLPEAMASQTKDELNFEFCGVLLPVDSGAADVAANQESGTVVPSPPATPVPLLSQIVDLCDPLRGIINFVLAQPPQDLTGKKLVVQIQGQQTPCKLDPAFPGELSCKLPAHTTWPAGIIVRVNDQAVNLFPYTGANCEAKAGPRAVLTKPAGSVSPTPVPPTQQPTTQVPLTPVPPTQVLPTPVPPTPVPPTLQPTSQPPSTDTPAPTEAPPPTQQVSPTQPG
jgi:hypothetical protein